MRVRENAESIAFYNGEASEAKLLFQRLSAVVENYMQLIVTSRNLSFFTSFYRCAHRHCRLSVLEMSCREPMGRSLPTSVGRWMALQAGPVCLARCSL